MGSLLGPQNVTELLRGIARLLLVLRVQGTPITTIADLRALRTLTAISPQKGWGHKQIRHMVPYIWLRMHNR